MAKRIYTEEEARQRKNERQREYAKRTGYAANNAYNQKTYTQLTVRETKEIAAAYKAKCDELGISYSEPLHQAIKNILEK